MNRVKHLLWALFTGAITAAIFWGLSLLVQESRALATHGKHTTGVVLSENSVRTGSRKRSYRVNRHIVAFDGHQSKFDLDYRIPAGTKIKIVYLKSNPKIARISNQPITIWQTVKEVGPIFLSIVAGVMLLFLFSTLYSLRNFYRNAEYNSET